MKYRRQIIASSLITAGILVGIVIELYLSNKPAEGGTSPDPNAPNWANDILRHPWDQSAFVQKGYFRALKDAHYDRNEQTIVLILETTEPLDGGILAYIDKYSVEISARDGTKSIQGQLSWSPIKSSYEKGEHITFRLVPTPELKDFAKGKDVKVRIKLN